jgi:hypothetical protein
LAELCDLAGCTEGPVRALEARGWVQIAGRQTLVLLFGPRFSGRMVVIALSLGLYLALLIAVFSRSVAPLALIALAVVLIGIWPSLTAWLTAPAASALLAAFGG